MISPRHTYSHSYTHNTHTTHINTELIYNTTRARKKQEQHEQQQVQEQEELISTLSSH